MALVTLPPTQFQFGIPGSQVTLMSTELNSVASAAVAVGTTVFNPSHTRGSIFGELFFTLGTVTTMTAGANLSGWFLPSNDGVVFELATAAPARGPDFYIPLPLTTGNSTYKAQGLIRLPSLKFFKVLIQNNATQTLTSTGNSIFLVPVIVQA